MTAERTEAAGATFRFSWISGEVVGTEQRSDTYTTGSSRTLVYEGTGGGSGHVSTEVVINRDIWFRDAGGQERHVRVEADIPVRVGQHVAIVFLDAERPGSRTAVSDLVSVYVLSTERYWMIRGLEATADKLIEPDRTVRAELAYLACWIIALALCFLGVGVLLLITMFVMRAMQKRHQKALAKELATALQASHRQALRTALRTFHAERQRLAEPAAAKQPAIRATS